MAKIAIKPRIAWEDRWTQPTLEQLIEPLREQTREIFQAMMEQIEQIEGTEQHLIWYGPAWRWTIEYRIPTHTGEPANLIYLVPNPETPVVSIPLPETIVAKLPVKRLNKYIRDGIRSAKCAVELHWAVWSPNAKTEVEHLGDLLRRKHKLLNDNPKNNGQKNGQK
ncbi:hypothetical protein ACERK3_00585 [Phycisphaerales bacterium AB-hyl4]|uniref:Uncharacterized protein n=1 Tax=Natronomicrosphaera hydrolytica TaxID=3242702 RepID=A0ABV4TZK2_9BACT